MIILFGRQHSLGRTNKKEQVSTMTEYDPKQVIIDYLSLPEGEIISQPDPDTPAVLKDGRLVRPGILRRGGGMGAKPASVRFLKERSIPHRQVHAVTFEDETGQQWDYVCFVAQDAKGRWHFESGGGGGGTGGDIKCYPARSDPWANLAGGGWEDRFWAGGHVIDNGLDVTRVRLTGSNGQVLEDTVDDGLVLFVTEQKVRVPIQVELYNRSGEVVGKHSWGP